MTGYVSKKDLMEYCSNSKDRTIDLNDIARFPISDVVEAGKITSVITRLRSNRDSNLTRYTCNDGKQNLIIVSQKDKGYVQALDDIEKLLFGWKEKENAEIH